jgi:hypothetical protein
MSTQAQVNKIVASFLAKQDDLLIELHSLGLDTPELQRPYVIKAVCEALTGGKGWKVQGESKVVLDTKHARFEFLKTRVRDVMNALKGEKRTSSSGKSEPVDAVSKLLNAFNKMSKAEQKKFLKAVA